MYLIPTTKLKFFLHFMPAYFASCTIVRGTVNSKKFVGVLFLRDFTYANFYVKIKHLLNGEITLLFSDSG